jgi:hypothetical protein
MTSSPNNSPPPDAPRDPELIARVVLGHTGDTQRADALRRIAADPEARQIAATLADVREAFAASIAEAADPPPAALFERAFQLADRLPKVPSWLDRLRAAILIPIEDAVESGLAGLAQPALRGARMKLQSFEWNDCRLDVSVDEATDFGSGIVTLRLQFETSASDGSGACVALDTRSGSVVAQCELDSDGVGTLRIDLRDADLESVELALHVAGNVHIAEGIVLR